MDAPRQFVNALLMPITSDLKRGGEGELLLPGNVGKHIPTASMESDELLVAGGQQLMDAGKAGWGLIAQPDTSG